MCVSKTLALARKETAAIIHIHLTSASTWYQLRGKRAHSLAHSTHGQAIRADDGTCWANIMHTELVPNALPNAHTTDAKLACGNQTRGHAVASPAKRLRGLACDACTNKQLGAWSALKCNNSHMHIGSGDGRDAHRGCRPHRNCKFTKKGREDNARV